MPFDTAARRRTDVYPVALASAASACVATALILLLVRPDWQTPVFDLPLGSYLLGGAGGLLTIVACPGWARRLGSRHRGRVAEFTIYRFCCAMAMGGAVYAGSLASAQLLTLVAPTWFPYLLALLAGILEAFVNEVVLRALGFLAPREIDPRLL